MRSMILGIVLLHVCTGTAIAYLTAEESGWSTLLRGTDAPSLTMFVLWPGLWVLAGVTLVDLFTPRRLLQPSARGEFLRLLLGASASSLGLLFGAVLPAVRAMGDDVLRYALDMHAMWLEWGALALGPVIAGVLMACLLPRVKRGTCTGCGYDLAQMTVACKGRCPECGHDQFAKLTPGGSVVKVRV